MDDLQAGLRRDAPTDLSDVGEDAALLEPHPRRDPARRARCRSRASWSSRSTRRTAATTARRRRRPGRDGDFITAPELHPIFGETLATAIEEIWRRLGRAGAVRRARASVPAPARWPWRSWTACASGIAAARLDRLRAGRGRPATRSRPSLARLADAGPRRSPPCPRPAARSSASSSATRSSTPCPSIASADAATDSARSPSTSARTAGFVEVETEPTTAARRGVPGRRRRRARRRPDRRDLPGAGRLDRAASRADLRARRRCCSSTTAPRPPSSTTRSGGATARCAPTSATRSTTIRTGHVGRQDLTAHVDVTAVERAAARRRA